MSDHQINNRNITRDRQGESHHSTQSDPWWNWFELNNDAMVLLDNYSKFIHFNRATCHLLGVLEEVLLTSYLIDFVPNKKDFIELWEKRTTESSYSLEIYLIRGDGKSIITELTMTPNFGEGGHYLCVFRDITQYKRIEAELTEWKKNWEFSHNFFEQNLAHFKEKENAEKSPFLIWKNSRYYAFYLLDIEGNIILWNEGAEKVYGWNELEVINKNFAIFFTDESQQDGQHKILLETAIIEGKSEEQGWRVRRDGSLFWVHAILTPLYDHQGKICGFMKLTQDISHQKKTEERGQDNEVYLRILSQFAPVGIFITDVQGYVTYVNDRWCELTQVCREEALGEGWTKAIHPQDLPWVKITWKRTVETGRNWHYECRFVHPNGQVILGEGRATPLRDINHNLMGFIGTIIDITEEQKNEETLQFLVETMASAYGENFFCFIAERLAHFFNVRFSFISEITDLAQGKVRLLAFWDTDQQGNCFEYSISGTPCAEVINKNIAFFPRGVKNLFPEDKWLEENGIESYVAIPLFSVTGDPLGHLGIMHDQPLENQPSVESILRIFATRTGSEIERKHAEEALKKSELQLREAQRIAHIGSWEFATISQKMTASDEAFSLLGLTPTSSTYKQYLKRIHPADRKRFKNVLVKMLNQPLICQDEFRILHPERGICHLEWRGESLPDSQGKIVQIQGTLLDITERKNIQHSLRESELKYKTLFEIFPIGISITDFQGNLVEANSASEKILGISTDEHTSRTYDAKEWKIIHPDGSEMLPSEFASVRALTENRVVENVEMGIVKRVNHQEEIAWILVTAAPIPLANYGVAISYIDITEWKQVEKNLYQKKQEFRVLVENTPDLIQRFSPNLTYLYVNPVVEKLTGLPPQFWIGKTYEEISIKPQGFVDFEQTLKNIFLQGIERTIEMDFPTLQGVRFYQSRLVPELTNDGKVESVLAISRDITERKSTEDAIVQHLEFLNALVETVGEGIIVTDSSGNFVLYNRGMEDITGYSSEESQNSNFLQCLYPNPLIYQQVVQEIFQAFHGQDINNSEWEITRKDGGKRNIIVSSRILHYGKSHLLLSAIRDITDRKLAESRLAKINDCFLKFSSDPHENMDRLTQLCGELLGANYVLYTHQEDKKLYFSSQWYRPTQDYPHRSPVEKICLDISNNLYRNDGLNSKKMDDLSEKFAELITEFGWTIRCQNIGVGVLCTCYQNKINLSEDESHVVGIIATAIRVEEERRQVQAELQLQMKQEKLLGTISQRIRQTLNLQAILHTTVSEIRNLLKCDRVLVLRIYPNRVAHVLTESVSPHYTSVVGQVFKDECFPEESYQMYSQGVSRSIPNVLHYYEIDCLQDLMTHLQVKSKLIIPLLQEAKITTDSTFDRPDYLWGLLIAHQCFSPRHWEKWETDFLNSLATQVAIAIHQSQLYEQLKQANQELGRLASLDGLTQLANRRRFDEYLMKIWREIQTDKEYLSLILCDVDYFKLYNDTYGHQAGDECLKRIAQVMGEVVQHPDDLVARYGGEEFAIILPDTDVQGAIVVAEKIREKVNDLQVKHLASLVSDSVSLSVGIATLIPTENYTPDVLIQAADSCLYQAKEQGRNRYCYQFLHDNS